MYNYKASFEQTRTSNRNKCCSSSVEHWQQCIPWVSNVRLKIKNHCEIVQVPYSHTHIVTLSVYDCNVL